MKKEYIAPELKSVRIDTAHTILTNSIEINGDTASEDGYGNYNTLSRGHRGLWDDDEEEEY